MKGKFGTASRKAKEAVALLEAIVIGDASASDIAAQLRRKGIASTEDLLSAMGRAAKDHAEATRRALRPINLRRRRTPTPPALVKKIVQVAPAVPVLLNGTLYDPKDLMRFNGQELHFVVAASRDYMLAVDDLALISSWHEHNIIDDLARKTYGIPLPKTEPGGVEPQTQGPEGGVWGGSTTALGPGNAKGRNPDHETIFYEDIDYGGDDISLEKNRGYYDLTEVSSGLFGWGSNWNDRISSIETSYQTPWAVLHEDIHWAGQTLSLYGGTLDLVPYGWNDRASSVETW
jgi:hypothetical protein